MLLTVLKSKLHRVKVTDANINYIGSITIDGNWMDAAGIIDGEQVAARLVSIGDTVIIIAYAQVTPEEAKTFKPTVVIP